MNEMLMKNNLTCISQASVQHAVEGLSMGTLRARILAMRSDSDHLLTDEEVVALAYKYIEKDVDGIEGIPVRLLGDFVQEVLEFLVNGR